MHILNTDVLIEPYWWFLFPILFLILYLPGDVTSWSVFLSEVSKQNLFSPISVLKSSRELSRTGCCMHRKADEDRATWPRILLYTPAAIKQWSAVFIDQQHRRVGLDNSREANKCKGWLFCSPKNCKYILYIENVLNVWMVCWFTWCTWTILNKISRKPGLLHHVSTFLMHSR